MGNYVFSTEVLLERCGPTQATRHRSTTWVATSSLPGGPRQARDFADNDVPGTTDRDRGYWRDVGTIDTYHESHMDLVSIDPIFSLYNGTDPHRHPQLPGAKIVQGGRAHESIVTSGCIIAGSLVDHSVLSPGSEVATAPKCRAVLMHGVGSRPRRLSATPSSTRTSSSRRAPLWAWTRMPTVSAGTPSARADHRRRERRPDRG